MLRGLINMDKFVSGKNINLRDITVEDAEFVLSLRTDENKSRFLHKTDPDLQKQIEYIRSYIGRDDQWYFIITDKSGRQLGTVRIYDVINNDDFCWGSWLIINDAPRTTAMESALLIYDYAFGKLGFTKCHFDVRRGNVRVQRFHDMMGARRVGETDLDILYEYSRDEYMSHTTKLWETIK